MLYLGVGTSELFLEKINDADKSFEQAYVAAQKMTGLNYSFGALYNDAMAMHNIADSYLNLQLYDQAELWLTRADRFFEKMYAHPETPDEYKTIVKAYIDYDHALLAFGQNKPDVAERYFKEVIESDYSKSAQIRYRIVSYLVKTKRYAEAADLYQALNDIIAKYKIEPSVDMIGFVRDKFIANCKAGRKDSALAAAMFALDYVDSALVRQKHSEATKFATIYETQQKDEEIDSIKGRPLFIYTDGLNEAENTAQEQFGDERLLAILRSTYFDNARQVIESLQAEVEQHRNGAEPNDDLTMVCIRVN